MVFGVGSAWAGDKTVVKYSFDDALSPALTAGSRVSFDYDKTSVITSTKFLNAFNNANGDPGASTLSLGDTDLSGETWTLSFEWAACGGCNSKADHTTLKAGDTNLFDLTGNSNWNTTVTITYAGSDGTKTLPVPGCDKSKRFTAATGSQYNTITYWHHFEITGSASGVKMTIRNSDSGDVVFEDIVLSETNVNPTSLIIEPCCGGAIGLDELSLSYYVEGEVIQTPIANYTAVDGINRTITATCETEGATLYYSTDGENWTEGASVTVSAAGNVYFKATKGTSESDILTFTAEAGEAIILNAPSIVRSDNTTVTITANQNDLLLSPTATIYYTYGEENGSFTGSKTLTVAADATITAYAEATGYTTSATSERAVALFPVEVKQIENTASKTSGWSSNSFSAETITVSERTYAALLLDETQWGKNIYLQTEGAHWGLRSSGNWYIDSNLEESWMLMPDMKKGDIIVANVTYPASSMVNATYSKYSFGTQHAYEVTEDGNVELAFQKISASEMDYLYGVYAYTQAGEKSIFLKPAIWDEEEATERYAAYVWNSRGKNWIDLAAAEDGIFTAKISDAYTGLILSRMNGETTENNWDNVWNQTADITFTEVTDSTLFTITGWDASDFETSKYEKAEPVLNTYTATFTTNQNWEKVYAYAWTGEGESTVKFLGDWPGTELTAAEGVYTVSIQAEAAPANIIFNNGNSGEGNQTADLVFEDGKAYAYNVEDSELMASAKALAAADPNAVAVGKLTAAIAAAQSSGDESNLQAAINQFNADNADMEKDETAKVATNGWKKFTGNDAAGVCATQFAPAIDTYDGRKNVQLAENYETTVETTGTIIYQDITGLANGSYKVGFYGNAFFTSGRGFESTMEDGATDVAYVFANDQKEFITARIATSTTENNFRQFDVEVTDGTIKLGMGKEKPGTNWHTMQIYQLTWFTTAKAAYAAVKAEMETEIAAAKALKTEYRTAGVDDFNAAIEAAEAAFDSNMLNVTEFEAELANRKAAAAAYKKANWYIDLTAGEYYIIDAEGGKMMAAGNDYGTRGIVNEMGLDLTLTPYTESRTVTIDSRVANGNNHFLGSNLYMDSSEWGWALEYQGFGFYILEPNSGKYINLDDKDNLVLSDTPREFIIVTKEGVMAQRMEELAAATAENPVDATFLIKANNFNRNDARNAEAWTVSEDCTNKNLSGGNQVNNCAESYHSTFTIMQTISGAPAGIYHLTAQGFYRQDSFEGDEPAAPVFFANEVNGDVPVKTGEEDGMSAASVSFANGLYTIDPIEFEVKEDGMIYLGITASTNTQWVIWDNFQLAYCGAKPVDTGINAIAADRLNGVVYNLNGQKVLKAQKGLYIINGKKVVKK